MNRNWKDVQIVPEFCDQGVDCYRLEGGHFLNEYYIVSEAETRKLMNHPEVVGYEVYASLVTATSQMMYYLNGEKEDHAADDHRHDEALKIQAVRQLLAHPHARGEKGEAQHDHKHGHDAASGAFRHDRPLRSQYPLPSFHSSCVLSSLIYKFFKGYTFSGSW